MTQKKIPAETLNKLAQLSFKQYVKVAPVWARQMDKPFVCDTKEGDNIRGKAGDYLCCGIEGEVWPVDKAIFESTYKEKTDE